MMVWYGEVGRAWYSFGTIHTIPLPYTTAKKSCTNNYSKPLVLKESPVEIIFSKLLVWYTGKSCNFSKQLYRK